MKIILPKNGERRIKRKFAILPVIVQKEIRWLENIEIVQTYSEFWGKWLNDYFIDKKELED